MLCKIDLYTRRTFLTTVAGFGVSLMFSGLVAAGNGSATPPLDGAIEWINSGPLTPNLLRGKVVLIDFWTYTCVNWRRTLPYLRAWAHKYKDDGLIIVGAHTPEFEFEKSLDNVRRAVSEMAIHYAVAVDSNYAIWNAFNNEYWPALYFIDRKGHIRGSQFGEGKYAEEERMIQQLLAEGGKNVRDGLVAVDPRGLEVAADWDDVRSPETYVGYLRSANFASPVTPDKSHVYSIPPLGNNQWALSGDWTLGKDRAHLNKPGGSIAYRFHARDVNLIMGPANGTRSVRFRVLIDGASPAGASGSNTDANGDGKVTRQDTYQLIRQRKPIHDKTFEIEFLDAGVEAFDFTFG